VHNKEHLPQLFSFSFVEMSNQIASKISVALKKLACDVDFFIAKVYLSAGYKNIAYFSLLYGDRKTQ
jgi:hypothetical protein